MGRELLCCFSGGELKATPWVVITSEVMTEEVIEVVVRSKEVIGAVVRSEEVTETVVSSDEEAWSVVTCEVVAKFEHFVGEGSSTNVRRNSFQPRIASPRIALACKFLNTAPLNVEFAKLKARISLDDMT